MAQNATIYKVELLVADMDRHYYDTHKLTVAKHPSEAGIVREIATSASRSIGSRRSGQIGATAGGGAMASPVACSQRVRARSPNARAASPPTATVASCHGS